MTDLTPPPASTDELHQQARTLRAHSRQLRARSTDLLTKLRNLRPPSASHDDGTDQQSEHPGTTGSHQGRTAMQNPTTRGD
jgi:hypothetical protein